MPFVRVDTNAELSPSAQEALAAALSREVAAALGKPERYVMVSVQTGARLVFAGTADPGAFLDVRSIGLPADQTPALSRILCMLLGDHAGIPGDRVFINFTDMPRQMWGWNGSTF